MVSMARVSADVNSIRRPNSFATGSPEHRISIDWPRAAGTRERRAGEAKQTHPAAASLNNSVERRGSTRVLRTIERLSLSSGAQDCAAQGHRIPLRRGRRPLHLDLPWSILRSIFRPLASEA